MKIQECDHCGERHWNAERCPLCGIQNGWRWGMEIDDDGNIINADTPKLTETISAANWISGMLANPNNKYNPSFALPPEVLPFDDEPLPLTVEKAIDAAIAKHAIMVEADCDCDDTDDDYYAVAAELEELEGVEQSWHDLFCELFNAPHALIENANDARRWYESVVK